MFFLAWKTWKKPGINSYYFGGHPAKIKYDINENMKRRNFSTTKFKPTISTLLIKPVHSINYQIHNTWYHAASYSFCR